MVGVRSVGGPPLPLRRPGWLLRRWLKGVAGLRLSAGRLVAHGCVESSVVQVLRMESSAMEVLGMTGKRKPGAKAYSPEWRERVSAGLQRHHELRRERARVAPRELEQIRATGTVPERLRPLVDRAEVEAGDLIAALGGVERVSAQKRMLVEDVARLGVVLRGELLRYVQAGDADAAARVGTIAGQRRSSLVALGLDEHRVEQDLDGYLRARSSNGSGPQSRVVVQPEAVEEAPPAAAARGSDEASPEAFRTTTEGDPA